MRAERQRLGLGILALASLALAGCASTGAPRGWLPEPDLAQRDPYGAWIGVELVPPRGAELVRGEFLAVDRDSVYVLVSVPEGEDPVAGIAREQVRGAKIAYFDPQMGKASAWVAGGTLGSASHGIVGLISIPVWLIAGSSIAGGQSRTALEYYPDRTWGELRMYARFPQGPPAGLHKLGLRSKGEFGMPAAIPDVATEFLY